MAIHNNASAIILAIFPLALGDGSDVDTNDSNLGVSNETDSEFSSLSHVDAPNDVIYMVCGVIIAMLLVGVIIVLVAVTINKLRKREETSSASAATIEAQQTNFGPHSRNNSADSNSSNNLQQQSPIFTTAASVLVGVNNDATHTNNNNDDHQEVTFTRTSGGAVVSNGWVFPPKAPTPNIYNCSNNFDALITANDKNGFKGFRKQFSGRFKRLVAKKPQEPVPTIPPELKPQLKTIYVY